VSNGKRERWTLNLNEWPEADRLAWQEACRPTHRLKKGGSASHLAPVSQEEIACKYGRFLGFLRLIGRLDMAATAAAQVTPENIEAYMRDLTDRKVSSMTAWNCIYKLRRAAQLLSPKVDFSWLIEVEKDLALVAEPRSKLDRLVMAEQLVEAGLTLIEEAKSYTRTKFKRARHPKRPDAGIAGTVPNSSEEFCRVGDRKNLQTHKRPMVDHIARTQHQDGKPGGAPRSGMVEPVHRALLKRSKANFA
jgi:hypothetical protein